MDPTLPSFVGSLNDSDVAGVAVLYLARRAGCKIPRLVYKAPFLIYFISKVILEECFIIRILDNISVDA
jgi:hypothetical protein